MASNKKGPDREHDIEVAVAVYRQKREAVTDKIARLRAQRLEHEKKFAPKKSKRVSSSKGKGGSLSDWLEGRKTDGRE